MSEDDREMISFFVSAHVFYNSDSASFDVACGASALMLFLGNLLHILVFTGAAGGGRPSFSLDKWEALGKHLINEKQVDL